MLLNEKLTKFYYFPMTIQKDRYLQKYQTHLTYFYLTTEGFISSETLSINITISSKNISDSINYIFKNGMDFKTLIKEIFHERLFVTSQELYDYYNPIFKQKVIKCENTNVNYITDFIYKYLDTQLKAETELTSLDFF